jgi:hypothetical protein
MNHTTIAIKGAFLCLACLSPSSCAGGRTAGEWIAGMPHWMGGLPVDAPPRSGTPEYDAWMTARAQEAARRKPISPNSSHARTHPQACQRPAGDTMSALECIRDSSTCRE